MNVGDVDRNTLVVDHCELAIRGRLAEPDLEQIGGFWVGDAGRERLVGVGDNYVFHLDDLWERRCAGEPLAVPQEQLLIEVQVDDRKVFAAVELDASEEGVDLRRLSRAWNQLGR